MAYALCVLCDQGLHPTFISEAGLARCPSCKRTSRVVLFPALLEADQVKPPTLPADPPAEGDAVCFYSPNRRATKECSHCGVLISDPWAAQWGAQTVCLKCLDHLREKGTDQRFQSSRVLWDNIALVLAILPFTFVLWWSVFVTAPAAVYIALWHWNSPRSMVASGRWRLVVALLLAGAQIIGGIAMMLGLWFHWFK